MREIRLPKAITTRFYLDGESLKTKPSGGEFSDDLSVIERNGAEVIAGAVMLEDRMIEAVSKLLFGESDSSKVQKEFFIEDIMGASDFSFAFKRRAFTRLLERMQLSDAAEITNLKAGLNNVMEWRNAFAHGKVVYEHNGGFVLQYYSGGSREITLDDAFFERVENTIRNCLYQCNGIIQSR